MLSGTPSSKTSSFSSYTEAQKDAQIKRAIRKGNIHALRLWVARRGKRLHINECPPERFEEFFLQGFFAEAVVGDALIELMEEAIRYAPTIFRFLYNKYAESQGFMHQHLDKFLLTAMQDSTGPLSPEPREAIDTLLPIYRQLKRRTHYLTADEHMQWEEQGKDLRAALYLAAKLRYEHCVSKIIDYVEEVDHKSEPLLDQYQRNHLFMMAVTGGSIPILRKLTFAFNVNCECSIRPGGPMLPSVALVFLGETTLAHRVALLSYLIFRGANFNSLSTDWLKKKLENTQEGSKTLDTSAEVILRAFDALSKVPPEPNHRLRSFLQRITQLQTGNPSSLDYDYFSGLDLDALKRDVEKIDPCLPLIIDIFRDTIASFLSPRVAKKMLTDARWEGIGCAEGQQFPTDIVDEIMSWPGLFDAAADSYAVETKGGKLPKASHTDSAPGDAKASMPMGKNTPGLFDAPSNLRAKKPGLFDDEDDTPLVPDKNAKKPTGLIFPGSGDSKGVGMTEEIKASSQSEKAMAALTKLAATLHQTIATSALQFSGFSKDSSKSSPEELVWHMLKESHARLEPTQLCLTLQTFLSKNKAGLRFAERWWQLTSKDRELQDIEEEGMEHKEDEATVVIKTAPIYDLEWQQATLQDQIDKTLRTARPIPAVTPGTQITMSYFIERLDPGDSKQHELEARCSLMVAAGSKPNQYWMSMRISGVNTPGPDLIKAFASTIVPELEKGVDPFGCRGYFPSKNTDLINDIATFAKEEKITVKSNPPLLGYVELEGDLAQIKGVLQLCVPYEVRYSSMTMNCDGSKADEILTRAGSGHFLIRRLSDLEKDQFIKRFKGPGQHQKLYFIVSARCKNKDEVHYYPYAVLQDTYPETHLKPGYLVSLAYDPEQAPESQYEHRFENLEALIRFYKARGLSLIPTGTISDVPEQKAFLAAGSAGVAAAFSSVISAPKTGQAASTLASAGNALFGSSSARPIVSVVLRSSPVHVRPAEAVAASERSLASLSASAPSSVGSESNTSKVAVAKGASFSSGPSS